MTRLEACVTSLGSGAPRDRASLKAFIKLTRTAVRSLEIQREERRQQFTEEDYAELERAAATGDYEIWSEAIQAFLSRLPGPEDMSSRELAAAIKRADAGRQRRLPEGMEERLLLIVEQLNSALKS